MWSIDDGFQGFLVWFVGKEWRSGPSPGIPLGFLAWDSACAFQRISSIMFAVAVFPDPHLEKEEWLLVLRTGEDWKLLLSDHTWIPWDGWSLRGTQGVLTSKDTAWSFALRSGPCFHEGLVSNPSIYANSNLTIAWGNVEIIRLSWRTATSNVKSIKKYSKN
jgi:hypothetical protein